MLSVKKLNKFLKGHTFTIKDVFQDRFGIEGDLNFKIEIEEVDELSNSTFFYVKIYCLPSSNSVQQLMETFFTHIGDSKTIDSKTSESKLLFISYPINDLLENFLNHFSIENVFIRDIIYVNHMTSETIS